MKKPYQQKTTTPNKTDVWSPRFVTPAGGAARSALDLDPAKVDPEAIGGDVHWSWRLGIWYDMIWYDMIYIYMGVSKNRGTPKWMVKIMENPPKKWMIFVGTTIFGNIHILHIIIIYSYFCICVFMYLCMCMCFSCVVIHYVLECVQISFLYYILYILYTIMICT